jgi:Na+-translocating ferredoxin:NAD+ oxidoreductase RnfG subunit
MRSNAPLPVLVSAFALLLAPAVHGEALSTPKDALKQLLGGAAKVFKTDATATPDEAKQLKDGWAVQDASATFYLGKSADGATQSAAVIVTDQGKEGPITAAVGLNAQGAITNIVLIDFSESRGKPASAPAFLKQFSGKDASNRFKLGTDIDGVSGATYTSAAMASIARRATALYKVLVLGREGKK